MDDQISVHSKAMLEVPSSPEIFQLKKHYLLELIETRKLNAGHLKAYFFNANNFDADAFKDIVIQAFGLGLCNSSIAPIEFIKLFLEKPENNLPLSYLLEMSTWKYKQGHYEQPAFNSNDLIELWQSKPVNQLTIDAVVENSSPENYALALFFIKDERDFKDFLKIVKKVGAKPAIFEEFFKSNNCNLEQFRGLIYNLEDVPPAIARSWASKKENLSLENLSAAYAPSPVDDDLLLEWLAKSVDNKFEDAAALIDIKLRGQFFQKYIRHRSENPATSFVASSTSGSLYEAAKSNFLSKRLLPILNTLFDIDNCDAMLAASEYLKRNPENNFSIEQLINIMPNDSLSNDQLVSDRVMEDLMMDRWFQKNVKTITKKEFADFLSKVKNSAKKNQYIESYLDNLNKPKSDEEYQNFIEILKYNESEIRGNIDAAIYIFQKYFSAHQIVNFSKDVYAENSEKKFEFFTKLASNILQFRKMTNDSKLKILQSIIESLSQDRALKLKNYFERVLRENKSWDTLMRFANNENNKKLLPQYSAIKDCFANLLSKDYVTAEMLEKLSRRFQRDDMKKVSLEEIFLCYLPDQISDFLQLLEPKKADKLAQRIFSYSLLEFKHWLSKEEYSEICTKCNFRHDLSFPTVGEAICRYLAPKAKISILTPKEITEYEINFSDDDSLAQQERVVANEEFKIYLQHQCSDDYIIQLFSKIFKQDLSDLSDIERSRFIGFCNQSRTLLAHLFRQKDVLSEFCVAFAGDGCSVNITNQANIFVYGRLLEDPCDQILFSYFRNLFYTVNSSSRRDLIYFQPDPFKHEFMNEVRLFPIAFFQELQKEFYDPSRDPKIIRDVWNFFDKLGVNKGNLYEILAAEGADNVDEKAAKIAAYLTVKKTMPDLLKTEMLKGVAKESDFILKEVIQSAEPATQVGKAAAAKATKNQKSAFCSLQ